MEKIEFQTEFECLLANETEHIILPTNKSVVMDGNEFFVFPVCEIPPFKVDTSKQMTKNYCICEIDKKKHCFLYHIKSISKKVNEKQKVAGENISISICCASISFSSTLGECSCDLPFSAEEYSLSTLSNFCIVLLKSKNQEALIAFCPSSQTLKVYEGNDFVIKDNVVNFNHDLDDFACSKCTKELSFGKGEIKEKAIEQRHANFQLQNESVCFAFLDCILNKSFSLSKGFLSEHLLNTDENKLMDFFGHFYKFFAVSTTTFVLLYGDRYAVVKFELNNNKIKDFYII